MRKRNIITRNYQGLRVQINESKGLSCRKDILDTLHGMFSRSAFARRTFMLRFDVRFPESGVYSADNQIFIRFMASLKKHFTRKGLSPLYLWIRERKTGAPHQHYHCVFLLDGNRTRSAYYHLQKAEELWARALGIDIMSVKGLIDYCNRGSDGYYIEKGNMAGAEYCFYWASYLAKLNTKENLPGIRDWGASQL